MLYVEMNVNVLIMVLVLIILNIRKREDMLLNKFWREILMHSKIKLTLKMCTLKGAIAKILTVRKDIVNAMKEMFPALINANVSIVRMIKLHLNQY